MIIGEKLYYFGAYLEKNGLDRQHIIDQEKDNLASLKSIQDFTPVSQNLRVVRSTDVYEPGNCLPFTPDTEDLIYQPYTCGYDDLKEKFGESDPFRVNGYRQWIVFSKKLYDTGFFEGKSDEEIQEIDSLLQQLTNGLDSFNIRAHMKDYAMSATLSRPINEMIPGYSASHPGIDRETTYYMTKEEWETELESSSKALQYFCNTFVPEEYQNEFGGLIDQFYAFNSQSLENYQSPYEITGVPYLAAIAEYQRQKSEQMEGEYECEQVTALPAKKDTGTYMNSVKAFFTQLANSKGKDQQYLLNHFLADADHKRLGHDRELPKDRMKDVWSKMFELEEKYNSRGSTK